MQEVIPVVQRLTGKKGEGRWNILNRVGYEKRVYYYNSTIYIHHHHHHHWQYGNSTMDWITGA
jgi:hypothetical protein